MDALKLKMETILVYTLHKNASNLKMHTTENISLCYPSPVQGET